MNEVKLLDCKSSEFEAITNDLLRQGWEIVNFAPQTGYIVALFMREVTSPTADTPISAAPDGVTLGERSSMTLGERLRWLRERSSMTLETVARIAGISISYLSDLERGRTQPSLWVLFKLSIVYGITASELLHGVMFVFGEGDANDDR